MVMCLTLAASQLSHAQTTASPERVLRVPLQKWLSEKDESHFRWTLRVSNPRLVHQQRLRVQLDIELDGAYLGDPKSDRLAFLMEVMDGSGHRFPAIHELDRGDLRRVSSSQNLMHAREIYVVPGDYRIIAAIFEPQSGEHSVQQKMLHVAAMKNDPLPEAWNGLPAVEFLQDAAALDEAFEPYLRGKIHLEVKSERRLDLNVVVNTAVGPARRSQRTGEERFQGAGPMLAVAKLLANADVTNGELDLALADLNRQRVVFEHRGPQEVNWEELRRALADASPNKIDVGSLAKRSQNAQFFASEVAKRIESKAAVIVLSQVMSFESGEDLHPVKADVPANALFFYLRFHEPPSAVLIPQLDRSGGFRRQRAEVIHPEMLEPVDSLASVVKPLHPRMFDIYAPDQVRKALRTIFDELAKQ